MGAKHPHLTRKIKGASWRHVSFISDRQVSLNLQVLSCVRSGYLTSQRLFLFITWGTSLGLGGAEPGGTSGHSRTSWGSAARLSQFLDTSLTASGQGRRLLVAASLTRRVCQGLELLHLQYSVCLSVPLPPLYPLVASSACLCGPPSHAHPLTLWISHAPIWSVSLLVFVLPRAAVLHNSRGRPFHRCALSLGLFLTLSQHWFVP